MRGKGKYATPQYNLTTAEPLLSKEWSPNNKLPPDQVLPGSGKKFLWLCTYCGEEWAATPANRRKQRMGGCPDCKRRYNLSFHELAVWYYLKQIFPDTVSGWSPFAVQDRFRSVDIFIPQLRLIVEYDSLYHHRNRYETDLEKTNLLINKGYTIIRLRENGLNKLESQQCVCINVNSAQDVDLTDAIYQLLALISDLYKLNLEVRNVDLRGDHLKILSQVPPKMPVNNLTITNDYLVEEWNWELNNPFSPEHFEKGSTVEVWWICRKNSQHVWNASIVTRTKSKNPAGCPYCNGGSDRISEERSLFTLRPELAEEWDYYRNFPKTPANVAARSNVKYYWKCNVCSEAYDKSPNDRYRGEGCPYCAGKRVNNSNSVASLNMLLATEWHPTKNGKLAPEDVSLGSSQKVWWQCSICGHEWLAVIHSRNGSKSRKASGCPQCYHVKRQQGLAGKKPRSHNSLATVNPKLASEWHPTKNGTLTPENVTYGSKKEVWWKCSNGHTWPAKVYSRNGGNKGKGNGCPYCRGYYK